jgi:hypothetical protein
MTLGDGGGHHFGTMTIDPELRRAGRAEGVGEVIKLPEMIPTLCAWAGVADALGQQIDRRDSGLPRVISPKSPFEMPRPGTSSHSNLVWIGMPLHSETSWMYTVYTCGEGTPEINGTLKGCEAAEHSS